MPRNKDYAIAYLESVVSDDIPKLLKNIRNTIKPAIETRIAKDPIGFGKPLRHSLKGYRRLRVGDFRIVYHIEPDEHVVTIAVIKHRKDVYSEI